MPSEGAARKCMKKDLQNQDRILHSQLRPMRSGGLQSLLKLERTERVFEGTWRTSDHHSNGSQLADRHSTTDATRR